jgi:hypothetical protein
MGGLRPVSFFSHLLPFTFIQRAPTLHPSCTTICLQMTEMQLHHAVALRVSDGCLGCSSDSGKVQSQAKPRLRLLMGVSVPLSFCLLSSPLGAHPRDHRCLPQRSLHQSYEGLPGDLAGQPACLPTLPGEIPNGMRGPPIVSFRHLHLHLQPSPLLQCNELEWQ